MARTITAVTTTAGETFRKKEDSLGRTYYVHDGEGRTSRQAFAAAHTNVSALEVTDDLSGAIERIAEAATPEPDFPTERDRTDETVYETHDEFSRDENVNILHYPVDDRSARLVEWAESDGGGYDLVRFGIRYILIREDGSESPSRRTTKYRPAVELFPLEDDFRGIIAELQALVADYGEIVVTETFATGISDSEIIQ